MSEQPHATNRNAKLSAYVRKLTTLGMLGAIGVVLVMFVEVPLFPAAPHLKYDPADVPILIATLLYGPLAGFILTFIVSFIQSFMIHGSSGVVGFIMHVVATGAMVIAVGNIYKLGKQKMYNAALALLAGVVVMTVAMVGMNLVVTPRFMNVPVEKVKAMILPIFIPFNLLKAGINSFVAFGLFKVVQKIAVKP
ncbi:ECF transporter S component [Ruminococcaceae bacterium OttesenSCG-928-L11]|nr:ECF transporter S component [Ruminococcaceae bacterium OttesenSCG-928-L11]